MSYMYSGPLRMSYMYSGPCDISLFIPYNEQITKIKGYKSDDSMFNLYTDTL